MNCEYSQPHCSSFSIDRSTVIALGGNQQIIPPAQPPHIQVPQWNPSPVDHHPPDSSDQAGEEFLRCIAANKPLPDYLKGNMAYNLADAFNSANVLKEAIKSDSKFQKHLARSKSRSRSRGRSRARSCGPSKSRPPSRSRARSKSHARGKSRGRSKSRARSRSRPRSRSRSQSRSNKKSNVRSKSRPRRSKSRSSSGEKCHSKDRKRKRSPGPGPGPRPSSSHRLTGNSLLEGLKLVMNSKVLEERLPSLKDAILTIQASDDRRKVECGPGDSTENSASLENDSMLLPHDRVGSHFFWLQAQSPKDSAALKADELEDEESFLYGNEDTGGGEANKSSSTLFASFQTQEHARQQEMDSSGSQKHQQNKSIFGSFGDPLDLKQPLEMTSSNIASTNLDSSECEKIKKILKSLGPADSGEIGVKMQGQKEGKQLAAPPDSDQTAVGLALPALRNPSVRQALESLQSLIKAVNGDLVTAECGGVPKLETATKEKREKSDGSSTSQKSSDKLKAGDNEEQKKEKQGRINKMESLMKELEALLKQDGLSFLMPVIGFYCQKCEEFIGDLNCVENHAAIHRQSNSSSQKLKMDKHAEDRKGHSHHFYNSPQQPHPSDHRDHPGDHKDPGDHRSHRDHQQDWRSHRAGQGNISLIEEMRKERMLITVSRGRTPPPNMRVKEEVDEEQTIGSKVKVEETDSKGNSSKSSREKADKGDSSDGSDNDKGRTPKGKVHKKKKKKEKKKKKDKS